MTAVFRHEFKNLSHSLASYVCGAFLLVFIGIGAMIYNIQEAVSNFEYVLGFSSLAFAVIIPLLTMRVLSEERKQKTDLLLYSLPITTTQVIMGKYLALLAIYSIPVSIILIYPLVFAQFGNVYLPTSYGSIFAFYMVGAALIALGVFISSLTENQGLAAGIGVALVLFNYFSVGLAEYVSATAVGSAISIVVICLLLGLLIKHLTGNETLSYIIGLGLSAVTVVLYFISPDSFEGLLPAVMTKLSLFARLNIFINGIFDIKAIVYYLSFVVFFLFLSVQSMEKRRYN